MGRKLIADMANDSERMERLLYSVEGWIDHWPWLSRYYCGVLQPGLGLVSPVAILSVLLLHLLIVGLAVGWLLCSMIF